MLPHLHDSFARDAENIAPVTIVMTNMAFRFQNRAAASKNNYEDHKDCKRSKSRIEELWLEPVAGKALMSDGSFIPPGIYCLL
jgi:hypothetical protein